ncbi:alpha/beta hydrolase-fold protein [Prevotella sp. P6B4]|uniref:alpha/beta hydrolase-fold protein n=1 Tax=Prevotella sp. P6B4 TaxID=1410614 RepID=UPI0009DF6C28|nr:alpha/beta hydrolase-fold protein [Prevotella sp. P6B4]
MKTKTVISLLLTCCLQANAGTICHEDGTVTFQYKNDQAKEVLVDVQFAGRKPMQKDAKTGLWTVTLGPAAPDMYPYCFIVDGVSIMDPDNPQYFPNEGFKNSLLEIKSKDGLPHDIKDVPHGSMEYIHYYSKSLGGTNTAIVYLPPNYMMNREKKYPVFYLISGTTDTEEVYYKVGRVNYILDNLLAQKAAKEMIIVLPYGNPTKLLAAPAANGAPQTRFGGDVFSKDLINDLMPYIEKNYRTINNKEHRAIGGFSRGGNQALFNGLSNLDKFSYLCSYSSFTSTDIAGVYDQAEDTNKKIRLFWLGVGTDDFLYGNARDYMEFLDTKGIRSVKEFTNDKFGHTWMNAKYFLTKTLPLLFNKKASEEAMKNGEPAPAKTGKEQQFTAGVMARLFPRPIISPEYTEDGIIFRFKAPHAKKVELECEMLPENMTMERDSDGVWSVKMNEYLFDTFKYCFVVDDMQVTDPSNMYISPDAGFKYSVADNPKSPFNFASQGEIEHGRVGYDLQRDMAIYISPKMQMGVLPAFIQLVAPDSESVESWFKVGGADAITDRLIADDHAKPCMITVSKTDLSQQMGGMRMPGMKMNVLKADDYPTWTQRRRALVKLLLEVKKQPDPQFPGMGGGFGGGPDM